jgi:ubiquinone/menaquinone biosynthesis C-methylase UbiE
MQERLAAVLELWAAEARQREMLKTYLGWIDFPEGARVLDVGCGTGAIARVLAGWPNVAAVVGVDPSPVFLEKARSAAGHQISFHEGDARSLSFADSSFDVATVHTCLTHVPGPDAALAELLRVLRPGGWLAIFDGDYATTTAATGDFDAVQSCIDAAMGALVHDRWLARRLPSLARKAGFAIVRFDGHAYVQTLQPDYLLTLVDRGADVLVQWGRIRPELAQALKAEARQRIESHEFYGSITFASLIARKPD